MRDEITPILTCRLFCSSLNAVHAAYLYLIILPAGCLSSLLCPIFYVDLSWAPLRLFRRNAAYELAALLGASVSMNAVLRKRFTPVSATDAVIPTYLRACACAGLPPHVYIYYIPVAVPGINIRVTMYLYAGIEQQCLQYWQCIEPEPSSICNTLSPTTSSTFIPFYLYTHVRAELTSVYKTNYYVIPYIRSAVTHNNLSIHRAKVRAHE